MASEGQDGIKTTNAVEENDIAVAIFLLCLFITNRIANCNVR